jgi:hypothetical protein
VENSDGDEIQGTVGDDARQAAIGSNIEQETNAATGNVLNVNVSPAEWYQAPSTPLRASVAARKSGKLMPDEALELRQAIDKLTEKISQSNVAVTRLEGTVGRNNDVTMRSISAFEEQLTIFKAQILARAPVWVAYLTVTFLAVIAVILTVVSVIWILQK